MEFSQLYFAFWFLPLFFICYYLFGHFFKTRAKNLVMLIFSLFFYAWGEPVYVILMIYSTVLDYTTGRMIEKSSTKIKKNFWLCVSLIGNLGLLAVFKYLDFFIETVNLIPTINLPLRNIALPIGISFYTFQTMSYSVDVYRGKIKAEKNILDFATYVTMFPQLIAGPVVRYETIHNELHNRSETLDSFALGLRRFIIGLSKKVLISNAMASVADSLYNAENPLLSVTSDVSSLGVIGSWIVMLTYTLHIYFDFSGYSDMAIGIGKMLGFNFLENFNYPYISKSITDFWRRWHISMSTFFRDYVYFSLGGNRCSKIKWIRNIFVVWFLTGLWHGAEWNFVLWGLYFAVILLIEKVFLSKALDKLPIINHIYSLLLIVYGWVIFRHSDLTVIGEFTKAMFGAYGLLGNGETSLYTLLYQAGIGTSTLITFIVALFASTPILKKLENKSSLKVVGDILLILLFALSVVKLVLGSYNPFIYFKF